MPNPGSTPAPTLDDVAARYPAWDITTTPGGVLVAYWQTGDGRHRRVLTARSVPELQAALAHAQTQI